MNAFSELAKQMELRGAKYNISEFEEAIVVKLKPLEISIGNVSINFNLYPSKHLIFDDIKDVECEEVSVKEALNGLYRLLKVNVGDRLVVKRVNNKIYILAKI